MRSEPPEVLRPHTPMCSPTCAIEHPQIYAAIRVILIENQHLPCGQLVEQHNFGLLIVRDVRVAVDSQIGPRPGRVVGEELALRDHRVQPKVAMSIPVPLQTTLQSDLVGGFDPDAVSEMIRDRGARAGESLENNNGRPLDSLPTIERGSELVVLPVANLKVRIVAQYQRVENLSLKTWPPPDEVHPRNEVIHLDQWRADAGRNPRSQSALTRALRTIDTDDSNPTICSALHDLGKYVVKSQYRHAKTIASMLSLVMAPLVL